MTSLSLTIDDRAVREAFQKAPGAMTEGVNTWIHRTAALTERVAKQEEDRVDTGQTQSSIRADYAYLSATVAPHTKQAIFAHEGRKPGKMPPFGEGSQINRWATKRGLNPFLVARSIGLHGVKPDRFMDRAYKIVKPQAEADADKIIGDVIRDL